MTAGKLFPSCLRVQCERERSQWFLSKLPTSNDPDESGSELIGAAFIYGRKKSAMLFCVGAGECMAQMSTQIGPIAA